MAQVIGDRSTTNILSNRLVIDMADKIALLEPNETPFMSFMKIAKKQIRVAKSYKVEWLEDDIGARWDAINNGAGYNSAAVSIVVDNGDYFTAGDIIKVPRTLEVISVTSVSSNTLTIVRAFGTTTAAALVDNDPIVIIGNANEEGSGARGIKSTTEVPKFNYTQIWKTPFGVTNTQAATTLYGGKDMDYQRMKKATEHKIDMARSMYFGELKQDTSGTNARRTTKGLLSFLTSNNYDAGGSLTQSEFDNNISEVVFQHGSKDKILLCGARLLSVINGWALQKLVVNQEAADKYGLKIFEYITPFGTYHLMNDQRLLEGAVYGGYGIVLDPENVKYCPLEGRDTKLETNIQANDADKREDQYITEAALEVKLPQTHAVITGVTS